MIQEELTKLADEAEDDEDEEKVGIKHIGCIVLIIRNLQ